MYGTKPYAYHLDCVVATLSSFGYDSTHQLQVGFLHDVLEDTAATEAMLRFEFGEDVAGAVSFCTDAAGENRKIRKARTYARMAEERDAYAFLRQTAPHILLGMRAKLADRISNVEEGKMANNQNLLSMYQKEDAVFYSSLYLPETADAMWAKYNLLVGVGR